MVVGRKRHHIPLPHCNRPFTKLAFTPPSFSDHMVPLSSRRRAVFELISPIPLYLSPLAANSSLWEIIRTENRIEEEVDDVVAISTGSVLPSRKVDTNVVEMQKQFCSDDEEKEAYSTTVVMPRTCTHKMYLGVLYFSVNRHMTLPI